MMICTRRLPAHCLRLPGAVRVDGGAGVAAPGRPAHRPPQPELRARAHQLPSPGPPEAVISQKMQESNLRKRQRRAGWVSLNLKSKSDNTLTSEAQLYLILKILQLTILSRNLNCIYRDKMDYFLCLCH